MKKFIISVVLAFLAQAVFAGCGANMLSGGGTLYSRTGADEIKISDTGSAGSSGGGSENAGPRARLMSIIKQDDPVKGFLLFGGKDSGVLEHNSAYDISAIGNAGQTYNFIFEDLGSVSPDLSKYHYDEAATLAGIQAGNSDPVSGTLDADKVIDLYYGYGFGITVNYLDKYTGEKIKDSFIVDEIENGEAYDYGDKLLESIFAGGHTYLLSLGSCDNEAGLAGNISENVTVNIYYGYYETLTLNYLSKYDGAVIKEAYTDLKIEHNSEYDRRDKLVQQIDKDGHAFKLSLGRCENEEKLSGVMDGDVIVNAYYGYYDKVTVRFLDKYKYAEGEILEIKDSYSLDVEHLAPYDCRSRLDDNKAVEFGGVEYKYSVEGEDGEYVFGAVYGGNLTADAIDGDVLIDITYGYTHKIVVNYRDKYTGEIIHPEVITTGENLSDYDRTETKIDEIETENTSYYYSAADGDAVVGLLDCDKNINFHYAYDNVITVSYRELETEKVLSEDSTQTAEHNSSYDYTGKTLLEIDGYDRLEKTTGDEPKGDVLDGDKHLTVWYTARKTSVEEQPATGVKALSVPEIVLGIISLAAIAVTSGILIVRKVKKERAAA